MNELQVFTSKECDKNTRLKRKEKRSESVTGIFKRTAREDKDDEH